MEVLGRYSNHHDQGERLASLLEIVPSGGSNNKARTKQVQRRLRSVEVSQLIAAYLDGMSARDLAAEFGIARTTVTNTMKRHGVRLHHPALLPHELDQAAELYRSGLPLTAIGERLGVDPSTVWRSFKREGVQMRDPHGRQPDLDRLSYGNASRDCRTPLLKVTPPRRRSLSN